MRTHVLMSMKFKQPVNRTYVYTDGSQEKFVDLTSLTVMRTGCHVLQLHNSSTIYVVHPGWRYLIQSNTKQKVMK